MPLYEYQCVDCGSSDQRIGGFDDEMAICVMCGSLMLRLVEDALKPYFANWGEIQRPIVIIEKEI